MKMMIQPLADFRRRDTSLGKCPQQGLNVGHQDRGRDAFAADVGNREDQTPVGKLHNVVVVAADAARWNTHGRKLQPVLIR